MHEKILNEWRRYISEATEQIPSDIEERYLEGNCLTFAKALSELLDFDIYAIVAGTGGGDITFPDRTVQQTAYIPGSIEAYDLSSSIAITSTATTVLAPANFINANGITYNAATGVFTWQYAGDFALSINLNAVASAANQFLYIYAQNNFGSGWVNNANSGKSFELLNASQPTQIVYSNAVTRTAGQQVRYLIYSNDSKVTLQTQTLPGVTPTVYVPAIRIQYAG